MSHDNDYCIKLITEKLIGATVTGAAEARDDFGDEFFGIIFKKDGQELVAWIDQDAERNGPGWVSIEGAKHE